jgi:hypothetical protein
VSTQLQACCINFNDIIKAKFGAAEYGLERRLPIALQFMTFSSDQRAVLKRAANLPRNIETMMDAFSKRLTPEELTDPHYAFRVNFVPVLANRPAGADQVIEFVKPAPGQTGAITIIKAVDRPKYRAGQIVQMMKDEGYPDFIVSKHTDLWKASRAKDPRLDFGSAVFGNKEWGWNERWLGHVREHCAKNSERYGKPAKQPEAQAEAVATPSPRSAVPAAAAAP